MELALLGLLGRAQDIDIMPRVVSIDSDRLTNELLDVLEVLKLTLVTEADGDPFFTRARRAADSMDITLGDVRQVIIDNVTDPIDIDAS